MCLYYESEFACLPYSANLSTSSSNFFLASTNSYCFTYSTNILFLLFYLAFLASSVFLVLSLIFIIVATAENLAFSGTGFLDGSFSISIPYLIHVCRNK